MKDKDHGNCEKCRHLVGLVWCEECKYKRFKLRGLKIKAWKKKLN